MTAIAAIAAIAAYLLGCASMLVLGVYLTHKQSASAPQKSGEEHKWTQFREDILQLPSTISTGDNEYLIDISELSAEQRELIGVDAYVSGQVLFKDQRNEQH